MKMIFTSLLILIIISASFIFAIDNFPDNIIQNVEIVDIYPQDYYQLNIFRLDDVKRQKVYRGIWSTLNQTNLTKFNIKAISSSTLKGNYGVMNLFDGRADTAWVEGAKSDGCKEWVKVVLNAELPSPSSTPFSVFELALIPGYAKTSKTWTENNRVKTALVVIHSPQPGIPSELEWVIYRLHFEDKNALQHFILDEYKAIGNQDPMTKTVWLRIEEVYKGTKYDDTCISELVLIGGCTP